MTLYQEREFHRRRLAQLEQQALETQNHTDAETNILRAQLAGARQEIDWGHQQRGRLEEQLQEVNSREQKAQQDLHTSREKAAKLAGEMAVLWKHLGALEEELTRFRRTIWSRARAESSAARRAETASSKTLTSSIAQMTLETAPPVTTTPTTRQAAAVHATDTAAAAGSQPSTQAGSSDVTVTTTQSTVQMTSGSPYPTPLPPPGSPNLPAGYPPYWGMYPYPYPQYVPPMPTVSLGGNLMMMNTSLLTPSTERGPTQPSGEPPLSTPEDVRKPSPPPEEAPEYPDDVYADMPPLEGQEGSEGEDEGEIESLGAVCTVAPVPKGRGCQ